MWPCFDRRGCSLPTAPGYRLRIKPSHFYTVCLQKGLLLLFLFKTIVKWIIRNRPNRNCHIFLIEISDQHEWSGLWWSAGAFEDPSFKSQRAVAASMSAYQPMLPKPHSGLAQSLSKGFAVATAPTDFKVHRTACVSVSTLTDRSYSMKRDLKAIL